MNHIEEGILQQLITGEHTTQPQIAEALGIHQSTVSRRLDSLTQSGLVRHVGANKGYALVASPRETVEALASPYLAKAREWLDLVSDA